MIETEPRDHVTVTRNPRFTSTTSFLGLVAVVGTRRVQPAVLRLSLHQGGRRLTAAQTCRPAIPAVPSCALGGSTSPNKRPYRDASAYALEDSSGRLATSDLRRFSSASPRYSVTP